jgi:predicted phosphodiesterase
MRTALISDIHGNYDGLLAVLADIETQRCDRILCLGDLVDGGPQSEEVVQELRERKVLVVQGNHDEYAVYDNTLPWEVREYLRGLPEEIAEGGVLFTHTSPREKKLKIKDEIEAWNAFQETAWRRVFVGDVHVPMIFGERCERKVSATEHRIIYGEEFAFQADDRYIACVGAVGYSRDGWRRLRYAIYDDARDTLEFRAPEGTILVF